MIHSQNYFYLSPVMLGEVSGATNSLKDSSAINVYGWNSRIIKHTQVFLVPALTFLFNLCIDCGVFPEKFNISRVVPIFQKGDKGNPADYRSISIIPMFGFFLNIT